MTRTLPLRWAALALVVGLLAVACGSGEGEQSTTTTPDGRPVPAASGDGGQGSDGQGGDPGAPTTAGAPRHFTIAASGDILLHSSVIADGKTNAKGKGAGNYDFRPMFDDVRSLISGADLAICHMETPISIDDTQLTVPKTLSFNAPHEIAPALKDAGFDACDTASNHTFDRTLAGVNQTLDVLDAAGLGHSGSARSQAEADSPPIYGVKAAGGDVKVGHLAYSYTIYNNGGPNTQVPKEAPWLKSMLWPALSADEMIAAAHALKARGANFVVVSIHWGDEYVSMPNAQQRQLAKALLASPDIDLILGDHVHVVQPCEKIGDKYVMYGMGNFLSNQSPTQDKTLKNDNQDGSLETYTVDEVTPGQFKVTKMVYTPTWVVIPGHKIELATPSTFKDSYDRTVKAVGLLGPGACDATPAF